MAQHDMNIANQSFPSFRTDLNNALSAINTMQSGTSRPSGATAGTMWLDTTSASSPTIKFFDGSDDISFATIDYTANTVNFLDSTVPDETREYLLEITFLSKTRRFDSLYSRVLKIRWELIFHFQSAWEKTIFCA